ncbi:MAG: hypothetical protein ACON47_08685 [Flavobacteriaceae bacterium]
MKKLYLLLFLTSSISFAQVINTRMITVDRGMNSKFETGVEKKTKMYNSKEGQLRFYTFRITTGPHMGKYFRVRYEDEMKGFDKKPPKAARTLWEEEVGTIMSNSNGRWMWLNKEASHVTVSPFSKPVRSVMEYTFKGHKSADFWRFRNNIARSIKESGADIFLEVWNCANGCAGNLAMVVFGHSNMEEYGSDNDTEWPKVVKKYNELFGENRYNEDGQKFNESLEMYGKSVMGMEFLPKLSSPEKMSKLDKLYNN